MNENQSIAHRRVQQLALHEWSCPLSCPAQQHWLLCPEATGCCWPRMMHESSSLILRTVRCVHALIAIAVAVVLLHSPNMAKRACPVAAVTFIECLTPVSVLSCNVRGCHAFCSSDSCACDTSIVTKFCLQNARCMSSKARGGVVALHGQGDEQTASEQLSSLVSDIVVSADGVWAALALHQRVEVFNIKTAKHHGHLPVFEVGQSVCPVRRPHMRAYKPYPTTIFPTWEYKKPQRNYSGMEQHDLKSRGWQGVLLFKKMRLPVSPLSPFYRSTMTLDARYMLHPVWCSPSDSVLKGLARLISFLPR